MPETCARSVDDFDDGRLAGWNEHGFSLGASSETAGVLALDLRAGLAQQPVFLAVTRESEFFPLEGSQPLELRIKLVSAMPGDAFAVLAWLPLEDAPTAFSGYFLAKSGREVRLGKGLHKYFWEGAPDPPVRQENVTLVLSLARNGAEVVGRAQILDPESGDRVLFERSFLDTPAGDPLVAGLDDPGLPFGGPGRFALLAYSESQSDENEMVQVLFDQAEASTPAPGNLRPWFHELEIPDGATFVNPARGGYRFLTSDDEPFVRPGSSVASLFGVRVFALSNGLVTGSEQRTLRADVAMEFRTNTSYFLSLLAVDAKGGRNTRAVTFDTFSADNPVMEVEDYNFNGGQFLDQPVLVPEGAPPQAAAYLGQTGIAGVDFLRAPGGGGPSRYRPGDPVRTHRSLDYLRPKFVAEREQENPVCDYDVQALAVGDDLTYTRTFPAGNFDVFLRAALVNADDTGLVLERVLSRSGTNAVTRVEGQFLGWRSGFTYRNIPLTDDAGRPVRLALEGVTTLRLRQQTALPRDGDAYLNYLVFVPGARASTSVESAVRVDGPYLPEGTAFTEGQTVRVRRANHGGRFFRVGQDTRTRILNLRTLGNELRFDVQSE